MGDISHDFSLYEFACPCCGIEDIDFVLVGMLQIIRSLYCSPIIVESGYRCPKYNKSLENSSELSYHMSGIDRGSVGPGRAADWHTEDLFLLPLIDLKIGMIWPGGWNYDPARNFIHCDTGPYRRW